MTQTQTRTEEAAQDIFFGQIVMNWARWFVIGAAAILILGTANETKDVVLGIWPIVGLMALNFYLHGRRAVERPANPRLITLASVLDVAVITAAVTTGIGAGIANPFYLAYYPVVLAFAFVMQPRATVVLTAAVVVSYAAAAFFADGSALFDSVSQLKQLAARLISLAAVGGLGAYFWRIQRRRRAELEAQGFRPFAPRA